MNLDNARWLAFLLILAVLVVIGCGGDAELVRVAHVDSLAPTDMVMIPTAAATPTPEPTETPEPSPTPYPTNTSYPTQTPHPTHTPAPTPAADSAALEDLQRGYLALIFLETTIAGLEEIADQLQAGTIGALDAGLSRLILVSIFGTVKEVIEDDAPTDTLVLAWAEAQKAVTIVTDVFVKWFDEEITSADVVGLLQPAKAHLESAIVLAEEEIINEYGVTKEALEELRRETQAEFREIFGE